ncbi:MAG: GAF domain-containing protein, partial [Planctomycetota bacterium]
VGELSGLSHRLAFTLAQMGRPVTMTEITAVHKEPPARIAEAFSSLERKGIVRPEAGRLEISNNGIRKALLGSRGRTTLRRRHAAVAKSLEKIRGRGIGNLEIAKHYLLGGDKRKGVRYGLAGIKAGEVEKNREAAVPILEKLLSGSGEGNKSARAKILFALVTAREHAPAPEETLSLIEEYRALVARSETKDRRTRMERYAAECHGRLNEHEKADAAWRRALELAEPGSGEYFRLLIDYANVLEHKGKSGDGERLLQEALDKFPDGRPGEMVSAYVTLGLIAMHKGQRDRMKEFLERAFRLAEDAGIETGAYMMSLLGLTHMLEGDYENAEKLFLRARKLALERGDFRRLAEVGVRLTQVCFYFERVDEALQYATEAENIRLRYGDFIGLVVLYRILGRETHIRLGYAAALKYLEKGLEFARLAGSVMMEYAILNTLGDVSCLGGDFNKAVGYAEESFALAERKLKLPPAHPSLIKATAYSLAGNIREAHEFVRAGLDAALKMSEVETILDARTRAVSVALFAGDFKLVFEQVGELEAIQSGLHELLRFNSQKVTAAVWFSLGRFGRVAEILDRIAAEPEATGINLFRAMWTALSGDLAVRRFRFGEAEKAFRTVRNLLVPDANIPAFLDLLSSEVELELCRRNYDAAKSALSRLEESIKSLPDESLYYGLRTRIFRSRLAMLGGDRQTAYNEAMAGLLKAKGAGHPLSEIELAKLAAATSRDRSEIKNLRENAGRVVEEITAPLDDDIRESVRDYLRAPPGEVKTVSLSTEESGPEGATESLLQLAVFLSREDNPQRSIEAIIDMAFNTMDAARAFLVIREDGGLDFSGSRYASGLVPDEPEREVSKSVIGRVIETGEPVFSKRAADEAVFAASESIVDLELMSILAVPVRVGGEVKGCLYLDNPKKAGAFAPADRRLAQYLASLAGAALERQLLMQQFRETSESLKYKLEQQSAEFEVVRRELEENRRLLGINAILGQSPAVRRLKESIQRSAATNLPVLFTGETGTGKDLAAKALHEVSARRGRFITVNCGAIPESLFQAELFGVMRGAFTGAEETKPGLVEIADGGTLYLDEIADLPPSAQKSLLRVLAENTIRRVGGREDIGVDVRVVSASSRNPAELVGDGKFRSDLLYRLNTIEIPLPPLRGRTGDIPILAAKFLENIAEKTGKGEKALTFDALEILELHNWPGNITELRNVLQRAFVMAEEKITPEDIQLKEKIVGSGPGVMHEPGPVRLEDFEREHILRVFNANNNQIKPTARALGITRNTLRSKLAKYREEGYL